MIVSVICNRDLLFLDKQYFNILKSRKQLQNSFISFNTGSACGYTELNNNIKLASEVSLSLNIKDDSSNLIFYKPLNIYRSIYHLNLDEFNVKHVKNQSTTIMLNTIYSQKNFERLLNIAFTYNDITNSYNLKFSYLESNNK